MVEREIGAPLPFGAATIRAVQCRTDDGAVGGILISNDDARARPAIIGLPGAFRPSLVMVRFVHALARSFDLLLVDPPEFGGTTVLLPTTIRALAGSARWLATEFLPTRRWFVCGESIGGIVGLEMAADPNDEIQAVAALDPPLSRRALETARAQLRASLGGEGANEYRRGWIEGKDICGDGSETGHWPLLERGAARVPTMILTGTRRHSVDGSVGSLLDEEDLAPFRHLSQSARGAATGGSGDRRPLMLRGKFSRVVARAACRSLSGRRIRVRRGARKIRRDGTRSSAGGSS